MTKQKGQSEADQADVQYVVVGCSCRSRFCPNCGVGRGIQLRQRLLFHSRLMDFRNVMMITLTVDGSLFDSPKAAWEYCRKKRVVSVFMRKLKRQAKLASEHWFCSVEWQGETKQVHFHLLVDATFVKHSLIAKIWNQNRPKWAGPVAHAKNCKCTKCGGKSQEVRLRPGFGTVAYSRPKNGTLFKLGFYAVDQERPTRTNPTRQAAPTA